MRPLNNLRVITRESILGIDRSNEVEILVWTFWEGSFRFDKNALDSQGADEGTRPWNFE